MKLTKAEWIVAIIFLYTIIAAAACFVAYVFIDMFDIAENIGSYIYIGIGILSFEGLIVRFIKLPVTKFAKFEYIIALVLIIATPLCFSWVFWVLIFAFLFNSMVLVTLVSVLYLCLAAVLPIILIALSKLFRAQSFLLTAVCAFYTYIAAVSTIVIIYSRGVDWDLQAVISLLLVVVPLILFCVLSNITLRMIRTKANPATVANFQWKIGLLGLILMIILLIATCFITSANDIYGDGWVSTPISGFIIFVFIPCALYFILNKVAYFKYKQEEEKNLSEKIVVAE